MCQARFVQPFQDIGHMSLLAAGVGRPRWIAGLRRLIRTNQGGRSSSSVSGWSCNCFWSVSDEYLNHTEDDENSIDPQFDDIHRILRPS